MRWLAVFEKSVKEQLRDLWLLVLVLVLPAFFLLIFYLMFGGGSTRFDLLIVNRDAGPLAGEVIEAMRALTYPNGDLVLRVSVAETREGADRKLKDRDLEAVIEFPEDFSLKLERIAASGARLTTEDQSELLIVGDLTNPYYITSVIFANAAVDEYLTQRLGIAGPLRYREEAIGDSGGRSEFEMMVPGIIILAVALLLFETAMAAAREYEWGTINRLRISRMTSLDFLAGISLTQLGIGIVLVVSTFFVARLLGFHSEGPLWVAILIGTVTAFSIIGIGLMTAAISTSELEAFLYGNFPLFLLMFFTGAMFPIPKLVLFSIGTHGLGPTDLLPATHAVAAMNKVLSLGEGLGAVTWELAMLSALSLLYFAGGVWLFQRKQMRLAQ